MYQRITVISGNLVEKNHVSVSKYRSNKIFIYSGALAVVVVVERCRHVLLFVLILAIRKGLNHGAEARRRLGIPRSTIYEQRYTLFLFRPVRGSVGSVVVASCGLRYEATFPPSPLPLCICGVVCHSQVLAKYARPFVSDLLFWHRRCSTLAANRIKCFCRVLSLSSPNASIHAMHTYTYIVCFIRAHRHGRCHFIRRSPWPRELGAQPRFSPERERRSFRQFPEIFLLFTRRATILHPWFTGRHDR